MVFGVLFVGLYGLHALVVLWSLLQLRRFLAVTPSIADEVDLQRYKDLVRIQMYLALFTIGVFVPGIVLSAVLILRHGCIGLVVVMMANVWMLAGGIYHKTWEKRVRGLEAASESLAREYRAVSETWVKKALPNF